MNRVLVTGGTGVTGTALIRYLLEQKIEVIALVRKNSSRIKYLPQNKLLHVIYCDMDEYLRISNALKAFYPIDAFFHLAWDGSRVVDKNSSRNDMTLQSVNIVNTVGAVELCHLIKCPCFLMTGSQAEFGVMNRILNESDISTPQNGYGSAKLCAETMTRIMCKNYKIKHIFARLFSVYGPYDGTNSLIYTSVLKLIKGERPKYTRGEQIWDFVYSFDVAKALVLLAEKGKDGEMYCVANGKTRELREYIRIIHEICNPSIIPVFGEIPYTENTVMCLGADIDKLQKDTGFVPKYSFEEGIKNVKKWCEETSE